MKVRDLKAIVQQYDKERGLIRQLFAPTSEMLKIKVLAEIKNQDLDVSNEVRKLLNEHWNQIKGKSRSYINSNIKATEMAYVRMAQRLDAIQLDEKKETKPKGSYVKISTLIPETETKNTASYTQYVDFSLPRSKVEGRIFQLQAWLEELAGEIKIENEVLLFQHLSKKYDKATLDSLLKNLSKVKLSAAEIARSKETGIVANLVGKLKSEHFKSLVVCTNSTAWNHVLSDIPERYFFKTVDNIGLDIRSLFLHGFINPVTKEPLVNEDIDRLKNHRHLGFSVTTFCKMKDLFSPKESKESKQAEEKETILFHMDRIKQQLSVSQRHDTYNHFSSLVELADHMDEAFLRKVTEDTQILSDRFVRFKQYAAAQRAHVIWSEMSNEEFFEKAALVINEMQIEMGYQWDAGTYQFFMAMRDFALHPATVIAQSDGSYIRSSGEYLVRVGDLTSQSGAAKALQMLSHQFRECFNTACRYGLLTKLMGAMTPPGICIAEKMRHMVPIFTAIASLGPNYQGVDTLHNLFTDIMTQARGAERSRGGIWGESDFLDYILRHYANKVKYRDEKHVEHTLDEATIRNYLIDTLLYDISRPSGYRP